jgi:large subunit ribosomal protein L21
MKYAVIATGGKQYKVAENDVLEIEKIEVGQDTEITFDQVLLVAIDEAVEIGQPLVAGATVIATVLDQIKGDKIRVAKFKAKARYRRVIGHRQRLTKVKITSIAVK